MSNKSYYRHAHPKGERDWQLIVMLALVVGILLSLAIFGVPSGLPA